MKDVKIEDFKVIHPIKLDGTKNDWDLDASEEKLEDHLEDTRKKLGKLQDTLYAHGKYAVLVCLQGMDTAGKDSLIREVFKDFNARGVVVHSLRRPPPLKKDTIIFGVITLHFPNVVSLVFSTEPITKTFW